MTLKHAFVRGGLSALALFLLGAASQAQSQVSKLDNPSAPLYFDASSGLRSFLVTAADMAGGTAVNSITIAIDFEKFGGNTLGVNSGTTPFYNEIEFKLTNPQNVTASLIAPGLFFPGSNGFRGVITFDDLAAMPVDNDPNTPQAGTFQPFMPLSSLATANGVGTWTLSIRDTVRNDHLGYYSSTLTLNSNRVPTNLTPEMPAGVQAIPVLLAVGAMALYQRKKKAAHS
ncbi:MAG: hypothetical protein QM758_07025 [Armatimonas sp.]